MSPHRRWSWIGLALLVLVVATCGTFAAIQSRWIYCPRSYPPGTLEHLPAGVEALPYRTGQGAQVAFYVPPARGGEPCRLWLMCSGQGNLALEMAFLAGQSPDREAGFVLFDYPGFGLCEGSPSPSRILASSTAAVETLRRRLGWSDDRLGERLGVFGYSLGTGAAMQHAAAHPVRRIVLAAPYTSVADMADLRFFPPCGFFVWHRFDSKANLAAVAARPGPRPTVDLWHGGRDDCIPPAMSARLAAPYPGWVDRHLVADGDHTSILTDALRALAAP